MSEFSLQKVNFHLSIEKHENMDTIELGQFGGAGYAA